MQERMVKNFCFLNCMIEALNSVFCVISQSLITQDIVMRFQVFPGRRTVRLVSVIALHILDGKTEEKPV